VTTQEKDSVAPGAPSVKKSLGIALLAVGAVALIWVWSGSTSWPVVRHELQSWLKPLSAVTAVDVEKAGPIRMFLNPDDETITPRLWAGQVWEATETHWFVQSLRRGDLMVDVGANVGYYTILGALLVGETGRVYAFEPDPVSFEILRRNVAFHDLGNLVLEQKAVSNKPGSSNSSSPSPTRATTAAINLGESSGHRWRSRPCRSAPNLSGGYT
jgi:hypothetical protein